MIVPSSPDPVRDPKGYQDMLVGLVGDDDPAEVQSGTADRIRDLLARAGDRATTRPAPTEWSVLECIAHISDAEVVASGRYRWILAHDTPELIGYDQDLWVSRLHTPIEKCGRARRVLASAAHGEHPPLGAHAGGRPRPLRHRRRARA